MSSTNNTAPRSFGRVVYDAMREEGEHISSLIELATAAGITGTLAAQFLGHPVLVLGARVSEDDEALDVAPFAILLTSDLLKHLSSADGEPFYTVPTELQA